MRGLSPYSGDEARHGPPPDVAGPLEAPLGLAPRHRPCPWLPSPALALGEGGSCQDERCVEPEDNRARACPAPTPTRARVALTRCRETVMSCSSPRDGAPHDVVQTGNRSPSTRGAPSMPWAIRGARTPWPVRGRPRRPPGVTPCSS